LELAATASKSTLQPLQAQAYNGLGRAKGLCRAREALEIGDEQQGSESVDIHRCHGSPLQNDMAKMHIHGSWK